MKTTIFLSQSGGKLDVTRRQNRNSIGSVISRLSLGLLSVKTTRETYGTVTGQLRATLRYAAVLIMIFTLGIGNARGAETIVYTLDGTVTGGTSAYDSESDVNQGDVAWKVTGNTTMNPWRIGGKEISNVDRKIYSVDYIGGDITKVEVEFGTSNITVNSVTLKICSTAANAADGTGDVGSHSLTFTANTSLYVEVPNNESWEDCYYCLIINVTKTQNSNAYVQLNAIKFYADATTYTLNSAVSPVSSGTVALGASTLAGGATTSATATPNTGYVFTSWSISGTGASLSSTATNPTTVTMGSTNATVTANFTAVNCDWFESFDGSNSTGGNDGKWNGSIGGTFTDGTSSDNTGWSLTSGNAANKCIKVGAGSTQGSATTPTLTGLTGTLTLKFRAAAWVSDTEQTTLNISTSNGTFSTTSTSSATVTLVKGAWTDYTLTINSVTSAPQITFQGYQANNSRFFIDYVCVKATPTTYTVDYSAGGGSGNAPSSHTGVASGSSITLASNTFTAPSGKQFTGWSDGTSTYAAGDSYTVTGDKTMTAQWCTTINHVEISGDWDKFGGETISLTATAYSSAGTGSPIADANLAGWQWQKLVGTTWTNVTNGTSNGATISGATTKNLQITNCTKDNSGKYRCVVSGGTTCSTASATATDGSEGFGVRVYVLECYTGGTTVYNFTRIGNSQSGTVQVTLSANTEYEFKIHGDEYFGNNGTINEDVTNWDFETGKNNVKVKSGLGGTFTFAIDYSANGAVPDVSVTYPRKTIYFTPGVWNVDGAKFAIYYFRKEGETLYGYGWTDFISANDCGSSANIPQWNGVKIDAVRLNNTCSSPNWDDKWGAQTSDITVTSNDNITITGWNESDYTYTDYAIPTYTISYAAGSVPTGGVSISGSKADESKTCGTAFTLPSSAVFSTTGYTQDGWATEDGGDKDYNLGDSYTTNAGQEFYPHWAVHTHVFAWDWNGGSTTSTTHTAANNEMPYGTAITKPANNTMSKAGHDFSGWSSNATTMPDEDLTITAQWTIHSHTLTLADNGTVIGGTFDATSKGTVNYGTSVTLSNEPGSHFTFNNWTVTKTTGGDDVTASILAGNTLTMPDYDITVTASFTEDAYSLVTFKSNNRGITGYENIKVYAGSSPTPPTLTDGVLNDACDATSDKHYGWTRNLITDNVADQATLDARTGSDVVYAKAATLPAITAGDDGTTITYHAVWAHLGGGGTTANSITSYADGTYYLIDSHTYSDVTTYYSPTGTVAGKVPSVELTSVVSETNNVLTLDLTSNLLAAAMRYTLTTVGDSVTIYNANDDKYIGSAASGTNLTVFNKYKWKVSTSNQRFMFVSKTNDRALLYQHSYNNNNTKTYSKQFGHYGTSNAGRTDLQYNKEQYGSGYFFLVPASAASYSTFITTCCDKTVALSDGTLSHCTISFSNANPQTCSSTDPERQVTITVTPDAGYEMTSSARLTFTFTGDVGEGETATADYISGPTWNSTTEKYEFIYQFTKDDHGSGTFSAECTPKTYRITLNKNGGSGGTDYVDVVYNTAPSTFIAPSKEGCNFQGYYTGDCNPTCGTQVGNMGGTWAPNATNHTSSGNWIKADNVTLYAKWADKTLGHYRTECMTFDVTNQAGTDDADVHLTSYKNVEVYSTEASGNLIRFIGKHLEAAGQAGIYGSSTNQQNIRITFKDADNSDVEVAAANSPFRLSDPSDSYNYKDNANININGLTSYDHTYSISYKPTEYNQTNHYKMEVRLQNSTTEVTTVVIDLYGRSLPKEFVIAAKYDDDNHWYALPNNLASGSTAATAITPIDINAFVDNSTTPTKVTNAPANVIYTGSDRFKSSPNTQFASIRFSANGNDHLEASSSGYKMWLSSGGGIHQNWFLKSSDLQAYEMRWDPANEVDKLVGFYNSSGIKMGFHGTAPKGHDIYFLPVEYTEMGSSIMEWGTDHVVMELRNAGTATKVKVQVAGGALGEEQALASVKKDEGVYRLAATLSSNNASRNLKLYFYDSSDGLVGHDEFTIPQLISADDATIAGLSITKATAAECDLVVLNGGVLTVGESSGAQWTFRDLYIYGGGKLVVPADKYLTVNNVYMRGGHLNAAWVYQYSHPQLVLNGTLTNASNTINYDYLTNNSQFYSLALPYNVTLSGIVNPDFNNKQSWLIHGYDGALRASGSQVSGWYDVEEGTTNISPLSSSDHLTAGVGYTFFGAMQKVNGTRQKWSVNRFPMTLASGSAEAEKASVPVVAHGMASSTTTSPGVASNDAGWNMLGNPYLADIGGSAALETSVKGTILSYHNEKVLDANNNWTGGWQWVANETNVRYVRIPNDAGTEYSQERFSDATLKAFRHFFIQVAVSGDFSLGISSRVNAAPALRRTGSLTLPKEMDVDFLLAQGSTKTNFGLTISDDFSATFVVGEDMPEDMDGINMKAYTLIDETTRVTYNGMPATVAEQMIPVGYRANVDGNYTFSYKEDGNADYIEHIWLTDMAKGSVTDLKVQSYTFETEEGVFDERFMLNVVFNKNNTTTDIENEFENESEQPQKFIYQDKMYILYNGVIYDAVGKKVREINK